MLNIFFTGLLSLTFCFPVSAAQQGEKEASSKPLHVYAAHQEANLMAMASRIVEKVAEIKRHFGESLPIVPQEVQGFEESLGTAYAERLEEFKTIDFSTIPLEKVNINRLKAFYELERYAFEFPCGNGMCPGVYTHRGFDKSIVARANYEFLKELFEGASQQSEDLRMRIYSVLSGPDHVTKYWDFLEKYNAERLRK